MSRRSGLGRGLGALIPQGGPGPASSDLIQIPLNQIKPNPNQPRKQFAEEALTALVDSIKAVGILQPVLVRETSPGEYEIIAGERRYRAARRAGLATIPAVLRVVDDVTSLEQALVENLQREDLNPLDEAGAYQQLIEDFGLTHDEVARRVGKSRTAVTNSLRLFQLPPIVQRQVRDNLITAGHARALLASPDRALQEKLAVEVVRDGLSVRAVEDKVRTALRADAAAIEDLASRQRDTRPSGPEGRAAAPPGRDGAGVTRLRPPGLLDLEELLGDFLNTRVTVDMGAKHGRVVIEFANLDDLERIYRLIIGGNSVPG
ncbi:MAG TPA: ParB/RepB/Spo0J family partition protein [Acidimicrobiales bacterium]|nr:ParB/RepB/Spo0J family partition protein [Acidimicrobiales bacterium]